MSDTPERDAELADEVAKHIRAIRAGHGANCSSIGSVVDMLFAASVAGGALVAAIAAALVTETREREPDTPAGQTDSHEEQT